MKAISLVTVEAADIMKELDQVGKKDTYHIIVKKPIHPTYVRKAVRQMAKDRDWFDRLHTAVDGDMLFITLKEKPRIQLLEKMLERVLPCIENEGLYDECMLLLYGDGGNND